MTACKAAFLPEVPGVPRTRVRKPSMPPRADGDKEATPVGSIRADSAPGTHPAATKSQPTSRCPSFNSTFSALRE